MVGFKKKFDWLWDLFRGRNGWLNVLLAIRLGVGTDSLCSRTGNAILKNNNKYK